MSTLRSDNIVGRDQQSSPSFPKGAVVTGVATATTFKGNLEGNVTGNVTGSSGSATGNAATATALQNARTIGGVSFDGTANINLPGVNVAGNQNTTGTAGGLTGTPSITVQDVTGVGATFTGNVSIGGTLTYEDVTNIDSVGIVTAREGVFIPDSKEIKIGNTAASPDLKLYHNGSHSFIKNITGNLNITNTGSNTIINSDLIVFQSGDQGETIARFVDDGTCELWFNNTKVFETVNLGAKVTGGLEVTGVTTASSYSGRHAEVPKNAKSGAYTLLKTDSGQCISTNSAVTVPNAVFASGDAITVFNDSSSAIALTQGSGLQLRKAGTTTTGSLSIKEFGLVTIWFNTGGTAIASGNLA